MDYIREFNIYFSDLTEDCQRRLLEAYRINGPEELNWDNDLIPVITLGCGDEGEYYD